MLCFDAVKKTISNYAGIQTAAIRNLVTFNSLVEIHRSNLYGHDYSGSQYDKSDIIYQPEKRDLITSTISAALAIG